MINYEAAWQVLADLITELRKAGEVLPSQVMRDLRSAKTTIHILKVDKANPDHPLRIEEFLRNVESYVMYTAEKRFGAQTVDGWMDRLDKARREVLEVAQPSTKFVPGVPRDKHWVRVRTTDEIYLKMIKSAASEEDLRHKTYKNGYVIVYGEKSRIQNFIKRMTRLHKN